MELAGGFGRPDAQPLASRIEQSFRRRLESLPAATRAFLLTAASEPIGDVTLLWRGREAGHRQGCRRPGRGRGLDRARGAGPVPSSPGARRRLPGGNGARSTGGAPCAGRGDRSRGRSGPSGLASRQRGGGTRRSGGGRAGTQCGASAGTGWCAGGGRVLGASHRAHRGSGPAGTAGFTAAQAKLDAGSPDDAAAARRRRMCPLDRLDAPSSSGCARSCSPAGMGATLHRCCSRRRSSSNHSTPSWPGRPTSMRSEPPSSPAVSAVTLAWRRSPRPPEPRRRARSRHGPSIFSWTAWPAASPKATWMRSPSGGPWR